MPFATGVVESMTDERPFNENHVCLRKSNVNDDEFLTLFKFFILDIFPIMF